MSGSASRRDFLKFAGLGTLALGASAGRALGGSPRGSRDNAGVGRARNVIFMVSDGMSMATLTLAQTFLQRVEQRGSQWLRLYRELPMVRGLVDTASAGSLVTDSAAAASCWGIGERINNGVLNITVDGRKPVTLLRKMKAAGKRTGLVTTATATHATPAGFVATLAQRSRQADIAPQYLRHQVDVVLGGGADYFSEDLLVGYRSAGYAFAPDRDSLRAYQGATPLLGLFGRSHLPYEIDRLNDPVLAAATPTLAEMTAAALRNLGKAPEGFFLLVEGGRVDHASHGNDPAATIREQLAFDATITTVLEFIAGNPDTLLVLTSDHGTGGMQLNGLGSEDFVGTLPVYAESTPAFMRMTRFKMSLELMARQLKPLGVRGFVDLAVAQTGLQFKSDDLAEIKDMKTLLAVLPKYTGIGWTSHNHTSEMVEFAAHGPGAGLFPTYMRNDEIHALLLKATGVGG